jgi:hypothetical protein
VLFLASLIAGYCFFIVIAGGDWMPGYRFIVHILPLTSLLWVYGATSIFDCIKTVYQNDKNTLRINRILWVACFLQIAFNLMFLKHSIKLAEQVAENSKLHSMVAIELKNILPPSTKIAVTDAGIYPFYTKFYTIDMVGLLDKHTAKLPGGLHQKFDLDYVLNQKPDLIQTHLLPTLTLAPDTTSFKAIASLYNYPVFFTINDAQKTNLANYGSWRGDKELYASTRFWQEYTPFAIVKAKGNSYSALFKRKL